MPGDQPGCLRARSEAWRWLRMLTVAGREGSPLWILSGSGGCGLRPARYLVRLEAQIVERMLMTEAHETWSP